MQTPDLTTRERDVLDQLVRGYPNKTIGARLGVTESTVKVHLRSLAKKTGNTNRVRLALWWDRLHRNTEVA